MTVSSNTNADTFVGNGATVFPLSFRFFDTADVQVYRIDPVTGAAALQAEGVDYSLSGAGEPEVAGNATGEITLTSALAIGTNLYVVRTMAVEQPLEFVNQGRFFPERHEEGYDRLTMLLQQVDGNSRGAIRVAIGDPEPNRLPPAATRASQLMGFDGLGNPIPVPPGAGSANALALALADSVDPLQGAGMVGRATRQIFSFAELRTVPGRYNGDCIYLVGYYAISPGYGAGHFTWLTASTEADDDGYVASTGLPTGRWLRVTNGEVTPEEYGADYSAATDTAVHFQKAWLKAIALDVPLRGDGDYLLSSVDLSSVSVGSAILNLTGSLKHAANATAEMIKIGVKTLIDVDGGGNIDGNQANQASWVHCITADGAASARFANLSIQNMKAGGISTQSSNFDLLTFEGLRFTEGAKHSGVAGQFCVFLQTRGGKRVEVTGNRFVQTTNPLVNETRQPCGFLNINTGATANDGNFLVEGNYFDNLGCYAAGNILFPLDFYSYADVIVIRNNRFRNSRLTPIRTSHGGLVDIQGNDVIQIHAQIQDGGAPYTDAALIATGLVDRGYVTDANDVRMIRIAHNRLLTQSINCHGVLVSNSSVTNLVRSLACHDNAIISSGTNSFFGLFANNILKTYMDGGELTGFTRGITCQGTSAAAPTNALVAELTVQNVRVTGHAIGVFARDSVTNLKVCLDSCKLTGGTSLAWSTRGCDTVRVQNCDSSGTGAGGDIATTNALWFQNNDAGASSPAGAAGIAYRRLQNNRGVADSSAGT